MNTLVRLTRVALAAACCVASAAALAAPGDASAPKTRAEVRAELAAWIAAGYDPTDWIDYPDNAQRAAAIVAQRRAAAMAPPLPAR